MITSAYLIFRHKKILLRRNWGKKSKTETLKLQWYGYPKGVKVSKEQKMKGNPQTKDERAINKNSLILAKSKLSKVIREKFEEAEGLDGYRKKERNFLDYFDSIINERKYKSKTYHSHSTIGKRRFEEYLNTLGYEKGIPCKFIDNEFAMNYRTHLMHNCNIKRNTSDKYWRAFGDAVDKAMVNQSILYNPIGKKAGIPVDDVKHKECLHKDEVERLLRTSTEGIFRSPDSPNYIPTKEFFRTCMFIGISVAEAKRLKWEHIYQTVGIDGVEKWTFDYTRVKTGKPYKTIPLSTQAIKVLKAVKKLFNSEYVFPNFNIERNAREYEKLRKWVKRAGIDKHITPHCVRSTFISLYMNNNEKADMNLLAKYVGHTNTKITDNYYTITKDKMEELANSMPDINDDTPVLKAV
jgi:integrase|tara:strand:+ start:850 stop:2076 length:1227 start_codon:yes stop_codon:yes gene_type:complete